MSSPSITDFEWQLVTSTEFSKDAPTDVTKVQNGGFEDVFTSDFARAITASNLDDLADPTIQELRKSLDYAVFLESRIIQSFSTISADDKPLATLRLLCLGVGALRAFLQSNVTGPPLPFASENVFLPPSVSSDANFLQQLKQSALASLSVDGESAYHLMPNWILLCAASTILNSPTLSEAANLETLPWWRIRVNFLHQRVLTEKTGTLHKSITADVEAIRPLIQQKDRSTQALFLVEEAQIDIYFGSDTKALHKLEQAAELTGLQYALTGIMGKRTKFQQKETSQLVVLAKSAAKVKAPEAGKPDKLDLNDDTLLEKIHFTQDPTSIKEDSGLSTALVELDPNEQPPLHPLDATILLLFAETVKNTNPDTGITREQMMPYAERVLSHSTNWEVYTLGLLVKSRIETCKSRTVERGVLQLQAVVDQVIAETTGTKNLAQEGVATTFLPRASEEESAPIEERLLYIHQLPIPTRWEMEAELASRWTGLGGLKTALEIYERLEMWPEVALCWAATEEEGKAKKIIWDQLIDPATGEERDPPPPQAPRMWCILGDIDEDPKCYERAWEVSKERYPRAQRSLGRKYLMAGDNEKAAEAYQKSLRIFPLHGQSWFALGCCWLELQAWEGAIRAFRRTVGIDSDDAEAWSNLATALLRAGPDTQVPVYRIRLDDEEEDMAEPDVSDPQLNKREALKALKQACRLKRESWRIWENYLTVAATLNPPEYQDILMAVKTLIEIRKDSKGEIAVDTEALELLVQHIMTDEKYMDPETHKHGFAKMVIDLVEKDVVPLITTDDRLWKLVARLELWRKKPKSALDAQEKAWRAVNSRPGITDATEKQWDELVDATIDLVDAYESLGQMERTEGLGAGEPVAKDWKFKARSSIRTVKGKGKQNWEDTKGWERLENALEDLKA